MILNEAELLSGFKKALQEQGRKKATIHSYTRDIQNFLQYLGSTQLHLNLVDLPVFQEYQSHMRYVSKGKESSIRRAIISLRQFFRFLQATNELPSSPLEEQVIPSRLEKMPRLLDDQDLEKLFEASTESDDSLKSSRDAAILAVLAYEGIKASELTELKWKDLQLDSNHSFLKIVGDRERIIEISEDTRSKLLRYKKELEQSPHPALSQKKLWPNMFISFKGQTKPSPRPKISRHGLKFVMYELGEKSSLGKINTEILRHYAIRRHLNLGYTIEDIMIHFGLRRIGNIAKHRKLV
ncbi:MAG: site-specific integrase [Oligoflexales bacterium]|nr:site-specific integrase [Oligoflexales bacterium]